MQRPDVDDRAGGGFEEEPAARVRGHAVEVPGAERDELALAGRRHVGEIAAAEAGIRQALVVEVGGDLQRIAPADPLGAAGELHGAGRTAILDQRDLDGRGADIDAGDGEGGAVVDPVHVASPPAPGCSASRWAKRAAPSAPV